MTKKRKSPYTDWILPFMKGYEITCCDCGLIHRVDFKIVKLTGRKRKDEVEVRDIKGPKLKVMFRVRRVN